MPNKANILANIIGNFRDKYLHEFNRPRIHQVCEKAAAYKKNCNKEDFIDKMRSLAQKDDYRQLLEHYGIEFWTHYYEGEHPTCLLAHTLDKHRPYRLYQEQRNLIDHQLVPCKYWRNTA